MSWTLDERCYSRGGSSRAARAFSAAISARIVSVRTSVGRSPGSYR